MKKYTKRQSEVLEHGIKFYDRKFVYYGIRYNVTLVDDSDYVQHTFANTSLSLYVPSKLYDEQRIHRLLERYMTFVKRAVKVKYPNPMDTAGM